MKDFAMIIGLVLGLALGLVIGYGACAKGYQARAVEVGVAHYVVVDPATGETELEWLTQPVEVETE